MAEEAMNAACAEFRIADPLLHEWRIDCFSSIDEPFFYTSPIFPHGQSNSKWLIKIFPAYFMNVCKAITIQVELVWILDESQEELCNKKVVLYITGKSKETCKTFKMLIPTSTSPLTFRHLIRREDFKDFLIDDSLTLHCLIVTDVDEAKYDVTSLIQENLFVRKSRAQLKHLDKLKELLINNKQLCDVVLVASDQKELSAHKVVLAAHSSVFLAMFNSDIKGKQENRIMLNDVSYDVLREMLSFMYTGQVQNTEKSINLLAVADKYGIEELKVYCAQHMSKLMSPTTVIAVLSVADLYNATELRKIAINYLVACRKIVKDSDVIKSISKLQSNTFEEIMKLLLLK